ncbi:hypothetical protein KAW65_07655 [candidate division WOR-3 bacterium]|nr:hypothetical protein [candidate division WOR-3 bacterium]
MLPFEIIGKLSVTPEQAKRMFDFDMKPGALGIVFQRRGKTRYIRNAMPRHPICTEEQKIKENKLSILGRMSHNHLNDLIRPVWNPLAEKWHYYSGHCLFIGFNMKSVGIPSVWENLKLTYGDLEPPCVECACYHNRKIKFRVKGCADRIGVGILNRADFKLWHFSSQSGKPIILSFNFPLSKPIIYVYKRRGDLYSGSVSIIPKYSALRGCK